MDWANKPIPFKVYRDLEPIPLPAELGESETPVLEAVAPATATVVERSPNLDDIARLLYFSAGITQTISHQGGGKTYFRAAACTGALYHIDLYLVCQELPGLQAGVYHFGVHDFALRRLRLGDFRSILLEASGQEPAVAQAPAVIVCASTYWRNAWKYQARAYRHVWWDSGTILANLLAEAAASRLAAKVVLGYQDKLVEGLLGLDPEKEGVAALVPVGVGGAPTLTPTDVSPLSLKIEPLSKTEVDYPAIREIHGASVLSTAQEAMAWRGGLRGIIATEPQGRLFSLDPSDSPVDATIEHVIMHRGSSRRFSQDSITFGQLSTALRRATRGVPADYLDPPGSTLLDLYLLVHAVDGIPAGAYYYQRDREALELLMEGDFRVQGGFLGLEQALPADASVDVFFLADLKRVFGRYGNRGYRAALLEAGILGGKLYLASYGQGFGASGLTFFDDETVDFFSPHAQGKSVMFLVAMGIPWQQRRPT